MDIKKLLNQDDTPRAPRRDTSAPADHPPLMPSQRTTNVTLPPFASLLVREDGTSLDAKPATQTRQQASFGYGIVAHDVAHDVAHTSPPGSRRERRWRYACPVTTCALTFKWESRMQRHLEDVHGWLSPGRSTCPHCSKSFAHEASLRDHRMRCRNRDHALWNPTPWQAPPPYPRAVQRLAAPPPYPQAVEQQQQQPSQPAPSHAPRSLRAEIEYQLSQQPVETTSIPPSIPARIQTYA